MTDGILRLIEDRELAERLGREARKISERANEDAVFEQWQAYLQEAAKRTDKTADNGGKDNVFLRRL